MAVVIESVSSTNFAASATVTITKPTGLAVGDLMVALLAGDDAGSGLSFATLSGWTLAANGTGADNTRFTYTSTQYKVANSADVAASNFVFTGSSMDNTAGTILRVSGIRTDDQFDTTITAGGSNQTDPSFVISHTPAQDNVLYTIICCTDSTPVDSPVINGTNPTWTRRHYNTGAQTTISVFTAIQSSTVALTSLGFNSSGTSLDWNVGLSIFLGITNASETVSFYTTGNTAFAPTARAGANASPSFTTTNNNTAFTPTGQGTSPTRWTNEPATTTTWTNET